MFFSRQSGSALIEVLVATLILGIGVIGLATAQTRALQEARQSWWQWQAQTLAVEMIERMQAMGAAGVSLKRREAWRERVAERLPEGKAELDRPSVTGGSGTVRIQWTPTPRAEDRQLVLAFRL